MYTQYAFPQPETHILDISCSHFHVTISTVSQTTEMKILSIVIHCIQKKQSSASPFKIRESKAQF